MSVINTTKPQRISISIMVEYRVTATDRYDVVSTIIAPVVRVYTIAPIITCATELKEAVSVAKGENQK